MKIRAKSGRVYDYPHYDAEERAKRALKRCGSLVLNQAGHWCSLVSGEQFQHKTICKLVVAGAVRVADGKAVLA